MTRRNRTTQPLPNPVEEPTISVERAAAILGIGRDTAYLCVRSAEIPSIRLRGRIRIPTAALAGMLGVAASDQAFAEPTEAGGQA